MDSINLTVSDGPTADETARILQGLIAYNEFHAGHAGAKEIAVIARRGEEIVGGLTGLTHWNWLHIRFLWIDEAHRRGGLGRKLMAAAEQEAARRGCANAHLDTFSFQALPFYERLGYRVHGQIEDYPPGHTRYYLEKRGLASKARDLS